MSSYSEDIASDHGVSINLTQQANQYVNNMCHPQAEVLAQPSYQPPVSNLSSEAQRDAFPQMLSPSIHSPSNSMCDDGVEIFNQPCSSLLQDSMTLPIWNGIGGLHICVNELPQQDESIYTSFQMSRPLLPEPVNATNPQHAYPPLRNPFQPNDKNHFILHCIINSDLYRTRGELEALDLQQLIPTLAPKIYGCSVPGCGQKKFPRRDR